MDICDTNKEIRIEERVLLYYKYDNHPVNCIKIFRSAYNIKPLGLRFLQFNLFNSSVVHGKFHAIGFSNSMTVQFSLLTGIPDFVSLYDGDIYNVSSQVIDTVTMTSTNQKKLFRTRVPSLSVKLFANGASSDHGFIAEVVTLPIAAIAFSKYLENQYNQ